MKTLTAVVTERIVTAYTVEVDDDFNPDDINEIDDITEYPVAWQKIQEWSVQAYDQAASSSMELEV